MENVAISSACNEEAINKDPAIKIAAGNFRKIIVCHFIFVAAS
ncbi:hypothetical protein LT85_2111 [Collimonas arenae]|uniref:Uncharacterized protein n=1 Tax=Collimonas arenae TaxID=279058 RepID=A0A0A1FCA5_9BURK|nr:hypothetical protein LT85_2111 [Collimonas arenae]